MSEIPLLKQEQKEVDQDMEKEEESIQTSIKELTKEQIQLLSKINDTTIESRRCILRLEALNEKKKEIDKCIARLHVELKSQEKEYASKLFIFDDVRKQCLLLHRAKARLSSRKLKHQWFVEWLDSIVLIRSDSIYNNDGTTDKMFCFTFTTTDSHFWEYLQAFGDKMEGEKIKIYSNDNKKAPTEDLFTKLKQHGITCRVEEHV